MDKYSQLDSINSLKEKGILTEEEFQVEKKLILWGIKKDEIKNEDTKWNTNIPEALEKNYSQKNTYCSLSTYHNKPFDYFSIEDYFSSKWRISRSEYLILNILLIAILTGLMWLIWTLITEDSSSKNIGLFFWLSSILYVYETFVFTIKRLHDFNQSGWFSLVPFYNFIAPLFVPWTEGDNRFWPRKR